jgi:hypothetical protein
VMLYFVGSISSWLDETFVVVNQHFSHLSVHNHLKT